MKDFFTFFKVDLLYELFTGVFRLNSQYIDSQVYVNNVYTKI